MISVGVYSWGPGVYVFRKVLLLLGGCLLFGAGGVHQHIHGDHYACVLCVGMVLGFLTLECEFDDVYKTGGLSSD